jgi:hypothetical protein
LNVHVGTDAAATEFANGCNISIRDYNPLAVQVCQHGISQSNAVDFADFIAQLYHFPDIECIRKNQCETDHDILHKSLQAKTITRRILKIGFISLKTSISFIFYYQFIGAIDYIIFSTGGILGKVESQSPGSSQPSKGAGTQFQLAIYLNTLQHILSAGADQGKTAQQTPGAVSLDSRDAVHVYFLEGNPLAGIASNFL